MRYSWDIDGWLVVWDMNFIFHILGKITPTDFHIFQRGGSTSNQMEYSLKCPPGIKRLENPLEMEVSRMGTSSDGE
jgi:hypothetical protein